MRTIAVFAFISIASAAMSQSVLVRQNGSTSEFFYTTNPTDVDLQNAINACSPGDTLILPGVTFVCGDNIVVDRSMVILGAGYDMTGATVDGPTFISFSSNLDDLRVTAADVELHGLWVDGARTWFQNDANGIVAERCRFQEILDLGTQFSPGPSNVTLRQCVVDGSVENGNANNVSLYNCFVARVRLFEFQNVLVDHCILESQNFGSIGFNQGVEYKSCIILRSGVGGTSWQINEEADFENCLFLSTAPIPLQFGTLVTEVNSVACGDGAGAFANAQWGGFNVNWDYATSGGCADGVGVGGTDAGFMDGAYPWKADGIPFHPHWESFQFNPASTTGGLLLDVNIEAEAQQN